MYHICDDHIDVLKNKYRYFMCNSNPLEESSNNSDLVDFDSELDITTGFNSDFKEDFIWIVETDSKKDS